LITLSLYLFAMTPFEKSLEDFYSDNQTKQEASILYFKLAAKEGNKDAAFILGYYYKSDTFNHKDLKSSCFWYELSAKHGERSAMFITGWNYYKGIGCEQNRKLALYWFNEASKLGDIQAIEILDYLETS